MTLKESIKVLKIVTQKFKGQKINWALAGSSALALRGVKIKPEDIDIITNKTGAYKMNRLLKKYEIKPVQFNKTDKFASHFGKFNIKGILVEVIGNFKQKLENGSWTKPTSLEHKEIIKFNNLKIPALSLNHEYRFYLRNSKDPKRLKEAKKIKEYLDKK